MAYEKQVVLVGTWSGSKVIFDITPELSESAHANYADISDVRLPASILIYDGSPSRTFSISAKLLSRSNAEADRSFKYLNTLKSWRMPRKNNLRGNSPNSSRDANTPNTGYVLNGAVPSKVFTKNTNANGDEERTLQSGSLFGIDADTPEVIKLYGYGKQFKGIPTVVTGVTAVFPSEVDYIETSDGKAWVPILQDVTIELKEAREVDGPKGSIAKGSIKSFDINKFKAGILDSW